MGPRQRVRDLLQTMGLLEGFRSSRDRARAMAFDLLEPALDAAHHWNETRFRRRPGQDGSSSAGGDAALATLKRDGIVTLPSFVSGERLEHMREALARMVDWVISSPREMPDVETIITMRPRSDWVDALLGLQGGGFYEYRYDRGARTICDVDPFKWDASFLEVAADPRVIALVRGYVGEDAMINEAAALRYLPMPPKDFSSWMWHHDGLGRKLNLMVYLTDVGERDQYMTYMKGSHSLVHPLRRQVQETRVSNEEAAGMTRYLRMTCTAPAGTAFLFDSNGIHRGNRTEGAKRDSLIVCYNGGRSLWPLTIPRVFSSGLSQEQQAFIGRNHYFRYV